MFQDTYFFIVYAFLFIRKYCCIVLSESNCQYLAFFWNFFLVNVFDTTIYPVCSRSVKISGTTRVTSCAGSCILEFPFQIIVYATDASVEIIRVFTCTCWKYLWTITANTSSLSAQRSYKCHCFVSQSDSNRCLLRKVNKVNPAFTTVWTKHPLLKITSSLTDRTPSIISKCDRKHIGCHHIDNNDLLHLY